MVLRETARLRAILERALLVVSATAGGALGTSSCAAGDGEGRAPGDASALDATTARDSRAATGDDASDGEAGFAWAPGCEPGPAVDYDAGVDAPNCEYRILLPCGLPSFVTSVDPIHCTLALGDCVTLCTGAAYPFLNCEVANGFGCDYDAEALVAPDGAPVVLECDKCSIVGRRPAGLARLRSARTTDVLGAFFAAAAYLEAASVVAFESLAEDLLLLGAPTSLVRAARRSARDEARHARVTGGLARRHAAQPPALRVAHRRPRSLEALAIENAVEGCVRETFGALVATWQAAHAADPLIARTMRRIAADETRHAALAWAVARWMDPLLDRASRTAVLAARRRAVRTLRHETASPLPARLVVQAGLPPAQPARALIALLERALWSGPLAGAPAPLA